MHPQIQTIPGSIPPVWSKARLLGWLCLSALVFQPVYAHHSVTAEYDTSKVITIDGQVRALDLGSPHSHLTIGVLRSDGSSVSWQTELASVTFLHRAGWTEKSLSLGERVRLTGSPSRNNPTQLYVITVTKADGSQLTMVPTK